MQIWRTRFAYSQEEWTPGIIGVAFAVCTALGAINVAIPKARFTAAIQQEAERALKRALGHIERYFAA